MTLHFFAGCVITGTSVDTKPNIPGMLGWRFIELDTGAVYTHDSVDWQVVSAPNKVEPISGKTINIDENTIKHTSTNIGGDLLVSNGIRFGRLGKGAANQVLRVKGDQTTLEWATITGGGGEGGGAPTHAGSWHANGPSGDGMFSNIITEYGAPENTNDSSWGPYRAYKMTGVGKVGGWSTYGNTYAARKFMPKFSTKFHVGVSAGADYRLYIVFTSNSVEQFNSDNELDGDRGFGLIHRNTQNNFEIVHNSGAAGQTITQFDSPPSATDDTKHTLTIETVTDDPGDFRITLDAQSKTIATAIPDSGTYMMITTKFTSLNVNTYWFDLWPLFFDINL